MYQKFIKRIIDIMLSSIGLLVLIIPMLFISIIIKIDSPGPVLFKQKRVGLYKKTFTIYKFRSMPVTVPKDVPTALFKDSEQLSKWQRFMRKASLDELPQLINIFKGDMSVIGPRPVIEKECELIVERDKYSANNVKPGLTGWAQINGRDELDIGEKAKLDGEYVNRLSFLFDCRCFFMTIPYVLKHDGVVEGGTGVIGTALELEDVAMRQKISL